MNHLSISESLKSSIRQAHATIEKNPLMQAVVHGQFDRETYGSLMANLLPVYEVLESEMKNHLDHPAIQSIYYPELLRTQMLKKDKEFYFGQRNVLIMGATGKYCGHIKEIAGKDPVLLVAHAYVRYMGDLSGGQMIKDIARKTLALPEGQGTCLHDFDFLPTEESRNQFKDKYRKSIDSIKITPLQREALMEEAKLAFIMNGEIFTELSASIV